MTLGQVVGRLVKEDLDRHDPGRPHGSGKCAGQRGCRRPFRGAADCLPASRHRPFLDDAAAGREPSSLLGSKRHARSADTSASAPNSRRASDRRTRSAAKRSGPPTGTTASAPRSYVPGRAIPAAVKRKIWAARRRTLPVRRSRHRAPPRIPASAANRSRVSVCSGRRHGSGEPQASVFRAPPPRPRGMSCTARDGRVSFIGAIDGRLPSMAESGRPNDQCRRRESSS